jgi:hypothetical protein
MSIGQESRDVRRIGAARWPALRQALLRRERNRSSRPRSVPLRTNCSRDALGGQEPLRVSPTDLSRPLKMDDGRSASLAYWLEFRQNPVYHTLQRRPA